MSSVNWRALQAHRPGEHFHFLAASARRAGLRSGAVCNTVLPTLPRCRLMACASRWTIGRLAITGQHQCRPLDRADAGRLRQPESIGAPPGTHVGRIWRIGNVQLRGQPKRVTRFHSACTGQAMIGLRPGRGHIRFDHIQPIHRRLSEAFSAVVRTRRRPMKSATLRRLPGPHVRKSPSNETTTSAFVKS